jgi:hypothetical protein
METSTVDKAKLGTLLNTLLHAAMAKPNPKLGWKRGASMANFIASLEQNGVDFSKVKLPEVIGNEE